LTGINGSAAERLNYESFGESINSSLTRFTYTGREKDLTTGLMYYRARWYNQKQSRFLSEDPIEFEGGMSFYIYGTDNPVSYTDPLGLTRRNKPGSRPSKFGPARPDWTRDGRLEGDLDALCNDCKTKVRDLIWILNSIGVRSKEASKGGLDPGHITRIQREGEALKRCLDLKCKDEEGGQRSCKRDLTVEKLRDEDFGFKDMDPNDLDPNDLDHSLYCGEGCLNPRAHGQTASGLSIILGGRTPTMGTRPVPVRPGMPIRVPIPAQ
jgi:RHS repeat-associated protein